VAADAGAQITELTVDDHACLTFGEAEELFDLTAAFVRDGLGAGLKVIWLSDAPPGQAVTELSRRGVEVAPALDAGQMTAAGCEGRLLSGQVFSADAAVGWLARQLAASRELGFPGLRIAMDMGWALRPVTGVEQLPQFEEGVAAALAGAAASVLCQYDRDRFDPVTLASVAAFHTRSVATASYHADAVLRICRQYAPPGIRIAGEIDYQAEEPLSLALAEAVRLGGDVGQHERAGLHRRVLRPDDRRYRADAGRVPRRGPAVPARGRRRVRPARPRRPARRQAAERP